MHLSEHDSLIILSGTQILETRFRNFNLTITENSTVANWIIRWVSSFSDEDFLHLFLTFADCCLWLWWCSNRRRRIHLDFALLEGAYTQKKMENQLQGDKNLVKNELIALGLRHSFGFGSHLWPRALFRVSLLSGLWAEPRHYYITKKK